MRTIRMFDDGVGETVDDPVAGLAAARDGGGFIWVELDHPEVQDFSEIEAVLGLHPLAVEDAVTARDRPKVDAYDGTRFCSLITLAYRDVLAPLDVGRVMVFVGDAFVVSVRQEAGDTVNRAHRRLRESVVKDLDPLDVLHAVLDVIIDDISAVSRQVEASILAAADRLFEPGGSDEAHVLYQTTLQLLAMAHAVQPLIEPLRHLAGGVLEGVDVETARRFRDVLDHALVLNREIDDYNQLVDHLRDSNDSRIALQQNTDMRKISAWAAIIAVPTAITGFYGMNVPYPGFGHFHGVLSAVVLQVVLAVSLFAVFRRRGWL
ncbi:MAG TPA: CorA family divalent cation transporter [Euzebyales bacterium]|nr:CorA family divalent cation transporter [Euzebyales bacterium]